MFCLTKFQSHQSINIELYLNRIVKCFSNMYYHLYTMASTFTKLDFSYLGQRYIPSYFSITVSGTNSSASCLPSLDEQKEPILKLINLAMYNVECQLTCYKTSWISSCPFNSSRHHFCYFQFLTLILMLYVFKLLFVCSNSFILTNTPYFYPLLSWLES